MKIGNRIGKAMLVLSVALLCVFALAVPSFAEGEVAAVYNADGALSANYTTLEEAIENVPDGGKIVLLANATLTGDKELKNTSGAVISYYYDLGSKNFTLDGGGNTLTVAKNGDLGSYIGLASGNLTLKNITVTNETRASYALFTYIGSTNGGVLNIEEGTVFDSVQGGNGSVIFIQGGGTTVNINGGEFRNCVASAFGTIAIHSGSSTVNINGGTITGNTGGYGAVYAAGGTVNVSENAAISENIPFNVYLTKNAALTGTVANNNKIESVLAEGDTVYADTDKKIAIYGRRNSSETTNSWHFYEDFSEPMTKDSDWNNCTMYLFDNVSMTKGNAGSNMKFGAGKLTIEGCGKTISVASGIHIFPRQKLTLKNLTIEKTAAGDTDYAILQNVAAAGTPSVLTLDGVTIKNAGTTKGTAIYLAHDNASLIADNITIEGFNCAVWLDKAETVTLNSGTITGNSATAARKAPVYIGAGVTLNVGSEANITKNTPFNIYAVSGAAVTGTVAGNNKCEGIIEDGSVFYADAEKKLALNLNGEWSLFTDFYDLLPTDNKYNGGTVYLLDDVTISQANDNSYFKFGMGTFTVEGRGKTISVNSGITIFTRQNITMRNLTVKKTATGANDYAFSQHNASSANPSVLTLENVTVEGADKNGYGVYVNNQYATLNTQNVTITGFERGMVFANGTVNLTDTNVTGNGFGVWFITGSLNLNGSTSIIENVPTAGDDKGKIRNVYFASGSGQNLTVKNGFSGKIGVHGVAESAKNETKPENLARQGVYIGYIESGATLADTSAIVSDGDGKLFAFVNGEGMLEWTKAPDLKIETDKGVYEKDGNSYGVIRFLTTSGNDANTPLEYFGTAFVKTSGAEVLETTSKLRFNEGDEGVSAVFGEGKGFIVDMDEAEPGSITLDENTTYTYVPVSYYKIKGIDKVQYVYGSAVSFTKANEKLVEYTD